MTPAEKELIDAALHWASFMDMPKDEYANSHWEESKTILLRKANAVRDERHETHSPET